jgi:hypothetical protein
MKKIPRGANWLQPGVRGRKALAIAKHINQSIIKAKIRLHSPTLVKRTGEE